MLKPVALPSIFITVDGGSFTGARSNPSTYGSQTLWYRGLYNLRAVLEDLRVNLSMTSMDSVVVSGCSAGGMSCYLHW